MALPTKVSFGNRLSAWPDAKYFGSGMHLWVCFSCAGRTKLGAYTCATLNGSVFVFASVQLILASLACAVFVGVGWCVVPEVSTRG